MNKLQGFWELKTLILPSVPWERYTGSQTLDKNKLWTVRVAVLKGNDFNLPRKVGVTADEAEAFARNLLKTLGKNDLVIYYPYFIAQKSGTLQVDYSRTVIEGVDKDLWNLLTHNRRDITVIQEKGETNIYGDKNFFAPEELEELFGAAEYIRRRYRSAFISDGPILLEWSYAQETDISRNPIGEPRLVFIEMKTVRR
ncbi:MAG: hypothetical protein GX095_06085 [Clostridiales bacterium]|jgi:hypothetical protein|nr:hypothetical protein [Clostridiales bacterium]HOB63973.1 hypothetical protein [Clostridia bacterium]HOK82413.1 hypothetical protein [Clostridia bacterium]HOL61540.1 hypothetical protein [Clostridia bacterium]HPO54127.1 hypothetical protein [Clostridia bacterium]